METRFEERSKDRSQERSQERSPEHSKEQSWERSREQMFHELRNRFKEAIAFAESSIIKIPANTDVYGQFCEHCFMLLVAVYAISPQVSVYIAVLTCVATVFVRFNIY